MLKTKYLILASALFLTACSPNEADFKSTVEKIDRTQFDNAPNAAVEVVETEDEADEKEGLAVGIPKGLEIEEETSLPTQINLDIPFFAQAPDGDWSLPWQEACEEASITLAHYFFRDEELTKEKFKEEVLELVEWQKKNYGQYIDTDIEETAEMLKEYFAHFTFEIIDDPTVDQMKAELAQGHPIVAPFAGRKLKNPFFSGQGPYYHMLVIKGYDDKHFITNDVGTRRGQDFMYTYETVMEAMTDWGTLDLNLGVKKVLVVK